MTHAGDLLSALVDGELGARQAFEVRAHLEACARCASELDRVSEARRVVRSLPTLEPPIPLLARARRRTVWLKAAASVAAGLLVVGIAVAPGAPDQTFDVSTIAGLHTSRAGVDPSISPLLSPGPGP